MSKRVAAKFCLPYDGGSVCSSGMKSAEVHRRPVVLGFRSSEQLSELLGDEPTMSEFAEAVRGEARKLADASQEEIEALLRILALGVGEIEELGQSRGSSIGMRMPCSRAAARASS